MQKAKLVLKQSWRGNHFERVQTQRSGGKQGARHETDYVTFCVLDRLNDYGWGWYRTEDRVANEGYMQLFRLHSVWHFL